VGAAPRLHPQHARSRRLRSGRARAGAGLVVPAHHRRGRRCLGRPAAGQPDADRPDTRDQPVSGSARIDPEIENSDAGDADATAAGERLESGCPLGLDPLADQQLAGITIWIFGGMVDLGGEHRRVGVIAS
jgi:hypothetical protein